MTEFEPCYVYQRSLKPENGRHRAKCRKTESPPCSSKLFVPLEYESSEQTESRLSAYEVSWAPQKAVIEGRVKSTDLATVDELVSYITEAQTVPNEQGIPTALLVAAPGNGVPESLVDEARNRANDQQRTHLIKLASVQCNNLKTTLRSIIEGFSSQHDQYSTDLDPVTSQGARPLNYDLEILCANVKRHSVKRLLLFFQDSEALNGPLISDLIELLRAWRDRIPFLLFFEITTSVDLFQSKLSNRAVRCLKGRSFAIEHLDAETLFMDLQKAQLDDIESQRRNDPSNGVMTAPWLGSSLSRRIMTRQLNHVQSHASFTRAVKYANMSHFFANPLSLACSGELGSKPCSPKLVEAIRNLPSFKWHCRSLLDGEAFTELQLLLDDDNHLMESFYHEAKACQETIVNIVRAVDVVYKMQLQICKTIHPWSSLYILAMAGQLRESDPMADLLANVRKARFSALGSLLDVLLQDENLAIEVSQHRDALGSLADRLSGDQLCNLKSGHEAQQSTLRTTIIAQKVELSQHAASLTKDEVEYTEIVDDILKVLFRHFENVLRDPRKIFPVEVLVYDLPSPYKDAFTPQPRSAIERALMKPYDYLGRQSCDQANGSPFQCPPSLSTIYNMYLECGSLINAADLWMAFSSSEGQEIGDDEIRERQALASFERAVAELKYLGLIRSTRKKTGHVARTSWQGL